jgi:hypothetical protein
MLVLHHESMFQPPASTTGMAWGRGRPDYVGIRRSCHGDLTRARVDRAISSREVPLIEVHDRRPARPREDGIAPMERMLWSIFRSWRCFSAGRLNLTRRLHGTIRSPKDTRAGWPSADHLFLPYDRGGYHGDQHDKRRDPCRNESDGPAGRGSRGREAVHCGQRWTEIDRLN